MFESVTVLARRLQHTVATGDPRTDYRAREDIIANARRLQSEAVRCIARGLLESLRRGWDRLIGSPDAPTSHQT